MITTLQPGKELDRVSCEAVDKIRFLIEQRKRFGLLIEDAASDSWNIIETVRENVQAEQGQFLSLSAPEFGEASLSGLLYAALKDTREGREFRINLPMILQNNPKTDSPFINRAILWQRLCDGIIEDENSARPTALVLEQFDLAGHTPQHDLARLIRFHAKHHIRRTFLVTIRRESLPMLTPELRELVDLEINT